MTDTLQGSITLTKRLRRNPVWERVDYGYCWVDLLLLANDQERETFIQGEKVTLKRGQLAWSLRSLEKEWKKSGEWVSKFLSFCKDHDMITVESNRRYTIITILNYEAYNPLFTVTEPDTETGSVTVTEPEQKGEMGIGNRKGEVPRPSRSTPFPEIPSDETVQQYCADYRDQARGVTAGIPEVWWRGWLANLLSRRGAFPNDWKRALTNAFTADFIARHPKALASVRLDTAGTGTGDSKLKKTGAPFSAGAGQSPAQVRFKLDRELEDVQARLDAAHETSTEPKASDKRRENELKQMIKNLEVAA